MIKRDIIDLGFKRCHTILWKGDEVLVGKLSLSSRPGRKANKARRQLCGSDFDSWVITQILRTGNKMPG
jgi:hypothetical protein